MALIHVHPTHPQSRLIDQIAQRLLQGDVVALPTDASYILAARFDDKHATDKIRRLRQMDDQHLLTLIVKDFSQLAQFALMDNEQFRLMKQLMPGPYVVVLKASKQAPRRILHASRKTIGFRMPKHAVLNAVLEKIDVPLSSATLKAPDGISPLAEVQEIVDYFGQQLDAVVETGLACRELSTVIDLTQPSQPELLRLG